MKFVLSSSLVDPKSLVKKNEPVRMKTETIRSPYFLLWCASCTRFFCSLGFSNIKIRIYKSIILPVVLYGCETWFLTLREEHRLRVFENRELRRIFGPKRDEVTGNWRKLHNEELHNLYCSPNIIRMIKSRRMRWAGNVARMGAKRNAYRIMLEGQKERDH
jgi:hypothetical protein